jgi:hypothetical protein
MKNPMMMLRSGVLCSLLLAVTGCGVDLNDAPVGDEALSIDEAALRTGEVRGSFARGGSLITFSSKLTGSDRAILQVRVNGKTLVSNIDVTARTSNWNGYNGAFDTQDKEALVALAGQMELRYGNQETLAPHEQILFRRIVYWAEAPAGMTLPSSDTAAPVERNSDGKEAPGTVIVEEQADGTVVQRGVVDATGTGVQPAGSNSFDAPEVNQACQVSDNDGITYISSSNVKRYVSHDASSHCFQTEYVLTGCSSSCLGRCGPGCGVLGGWGVWSQDCADHDRSCRLHGGCTNPLDGSSGDEFREADDDYLWGTPKNKC